ncbi:Xaa-Pro peptidase family protein [Paenibacillus sp. PAMC21692]|uniref:M24 family metallopeptidase n=1 Tax=Paenibacillus sp. PAMC21692 TaxID=2762320 RepID=UPI00164DD073|nr:Xaa-Pro peptidase family protein [Paenibacillus sp. PAMC21692]QNK59544.1 aminopeptidase P family protein [Paenibacillus sp. PAMC21692]
MSTRICIPDYEYKERIQRAAKLVQQKGLDALLVNSNEADYANARYFSGFWPLFERAGVVITAAGDAALLVGPESTVYASDFGKIDKIFTLMEYRESANPAYPELRPNTYRDVFKALGLTGDKLKIGVASLLDTTVVMMEGLKNNYPEAEIVGADDIMVSLRRIKSVNELACMREGYRIAELATEEVIRTIRPGVTESQMVGVAQRVIYEHGAEYEGLPMYIFSEKSTSHAISRSSHRVINAGDIVQLNLSAKVDGYSAAVGLPISLGKLTSERRDVIEFGLRAHEWTQAQLKAGVVASDVAKGFIKFFGDNGYADNYLYGPCHGTGMIEVEAPWMETSSEYLLEPNMTFQIDTFVMTPTFGIRWEKGVVITPGGCELMCQPVGTVHELEF